MGGEKRKVGSDPHDQAVGSCDHGTGGGWFLAGQPAVSAWRAVSDGSAKHPVRPGEILGRSEEHTSELQSLMRISYAVFCLKKKNKNNTKTIITIESKNNTSISLRYKKIML